MKRDINEFTQLIGGTHYSPGNIKLSPEMRFLLSCCCRNSGENYKTATVKMIPDDLDWNRFLQLVNYHQILPIVYCNLQKYATEVPPQELVLFKNLFKKRRMHSMKLMAELVRLVKLFQQHGIKVICLKGPVLALQLYGDIALRHIMDIDLLVDIKDLKKIHQLMICSGFVSKHPELFTSALHWKVFERSKHHVPYHHKEKSLSLELHFRLFKNIHIFPNDELKAWVNPQSIIYANAELNTLADIDNVLFLFVHGSIHKWYLLKWLIDIAQLYQSQWNGWKKLMQRAVEMDLQRPVIQGVLLLNHLFSLPLPEIFSGFPLDKSVRKLTYHALTVINEARETSRFGIFFAFQSRFYLLKLKKRMRYKLRYLRDLFYLDSHRRILRLPGFLFPLYLILNPFLWFYKNYIKRKK